MPYGDLVHMEFLTTDFEKFKKFYGFFGWTFRKWGDDEEYMLFMFPNDKLGGGIVLVKEPSPLKNMELYIYTPNIDETMPKAIEAGWMPVREKSPIPGVGFFSTIEDFDGNRINLFEDIPGAMM